MNDSKESNSPSREQSPDQEFSMFGVSFKGSEGAEEIGKKLGAEVAKKYIRRSWIVGAIPPLFLIVILSTSSGFNSSEVKIGGLLMGLVIVGYICWASYWGMHRIILQLQEKPIAHSRWFWALYVFVLGPIFLVIPGVLVGIAGIGVFEYLKCRRMAKKVVSDNEGWMVLIAAVTTIPFVAVSTVFLYKAAN